MTTHRDSDRFIVRLPDGMRDRIKTVAAANNRSMNAEVVATLEEKYPPPPEEDQLARLLKHQGELFERIMDKEDGEQRQAMVEEFNALRTRIEEIVGIQVISDYFEHRSSFRSKSSKSDFSD